MDSWPSLSLSKALFQRTPQLNATKNKQTLWQSDFLKLGELERKSSDGHWWSWDTSGRIEKIFHIKEWTGFRHIRQCSLWHRSQEIPTDQSPMSTNSSLNKTTSDQCSTRNQVPIWLSFRSFGMEMYGRWPSFLLICSSLSTVETQHYNTLETYNGYWTWWAVEQVFPFKNSYLGRGYLS